VPSILVVDARAGAYQLTKDFDMTLLGCRHQSRFARSVLRIRGKAGSKKTANLGCIAGTHPTEKFLITRTHTGFSGRAPAHVSRELACAE
jgi:hypothetical protein